MFLTNEGQVLKTNADGQVVHIPLDIKAKEICCGGNDLILSEDASLYIQTEDQEFIRVDTIDKPILQIASSKNIACALDNSGFLWLWG